MQSHPSSTPMVRGCRCLSVVLAALVVAVIGANAGAANRGFPRPPVSKIVTISNAGLSVTFKISWGVVVVGIANKNVAHGLNIVNANDVGRKLQVDRFLSRRIHGRLELMINPTQAGAEGGQGYNQHPKGIAIPEKGSPVVRWSVSGYHFHAVIKPWNYDTGHPTRFVYVEDVGINSRGVSHFHYTFYDHEPKKYVMGTEVPTLYSDRTNAFMYPPTCPYTRPNAAYHKGKVSAWPVKLVIESPSWPQLGIASKGWIANIDTGDNLGIFYTTPVGLSEIFGTFRAADVGVFDTPPLGKTTVTANVTSYPGEVYSIDVSVLVSTPKKGSALISRQPPAVLKAIDNIPPARRQP
ncbi:MAG: hypothetical protein ACP5I8_02990 [Phycisphaerae bacterium]